VAFPDEACVDVKTTSTSCVVKGLLFASLTVTATLVEPPYDKLDKPRVIGERFKIGRFTLNSALFDTSLPSTVADAVTWPCPETDPTVN
jgi:hypothetical protein